MNHDDSFVSAYRAVFEAEFASLFRYVNRSVGDAAATADIAQEAFVRLYQRGSLPEDERAWLAAVANNLMRDEYRKSKRRRRLLEQNAGVLRESGSVPDPEEGVVEDERRRRVRRALRTLPERQRQALLLRYEGYSYAEIATALDYRASGVGKLIVRATRAFRAAYEEAYAPE